MAIEVKIPAVGESITSGVVSAWHKKSGDFVNEGEPLFTLETDKVSTEIVAEKAGTLETKVPEGQEVKIGEVVATIDDSKQPAEQKKEAPSKKAPEQRKEAEPSKKPTEKKEPVAAAVDRSGPESSRDIGTTTLSPAVRRIVEEEKLEAEKIRGTGEGGRLTKEDVLAAVQERGKAGEKIDTREVQLSGDGRFVRKKMRRCSGKLRHKLWKASHRAQILKHLKKA